MENGATRQEAMARLTTPFDQSEVKTRPGNGGREFRYVQPASIIRRLNEAVGNWNFEVRREWTDNGVTKALVRLEIPGLGYREHIGIQEQGGNQGADALAKGAVSDGLKKAASLFGIALDLYDDVPQQQWTNGPQQPQQQGQFQNIQQLPNNANWQNGNPQPQQQAPQQQQFNQQQQNGPRRYNAQYEDGQMPSEAQGRKLWVETQRSGHSPEEAAQAAGVPNFRSVDSLTKKQMSAMIDWLTYQPDGLGVAHPPQHSTRNDGTNGPAIYNDTGDQVLPNNYYDDADLNNVPF